MKWLFSRIFTHWQTTLGGLLVLVALIWFHQGKIDWADFKEYVLFIPTIILFLMKDWSKEKK